MCAAHTSTTDSAQGVNWKHMPNTCQTKTSVRGLFAKCQWMEHCPMQRQCSLHLCHLPLHLLHQHQLKQLTTAKEPSQTSTVLGTLLSKKRRQPDFYLWALGSFESYLYWLNLCWLLVTCIGDTCVGYLCWYFCFLNFFFILVI